MDDLLTLSETPQASTALLFSFNDGFSEHLNEYFQLSYFQRQYRKNHTHHRYNPEPYCYLTFMIP